MPFYEYACDPCLIIYKTRHGINEPGPDKCPKCSGALRKVLSAPEPEHAQLFQPDRGQIRQPVGQRRDREGEGAAEGLPDHLDSARGQAQSVGRRSLSSRHRAHDQTARA